MVMVCVCVCVCVVVLCLLVVVALRGLGEMKVKEPRRIGSAAQPLAHAGVQDCDPLQVLKGSIFEWPASRF